MKNCCKVAGDDGGWSFVNVFVDQLIEGDEGDDDEGDKLVSPKAILVTRWEPKWWNTRSFSWSFPATSVYSHLSPP